MEAPQTPQPPQPLTWQKVLDWLRAAPAGASCDVLKAAIAHPKEAGASRSIGLGLGQSADYRWTLGDCRGLHAQEFDDHYSVHLDEVAPACDLAGHLQVDAPPLFLLACCGLGALAGRCFGGRSAVVVGGALGVIVGSVVPPPAVFARR